MDKQTDSQKDSVTAYLDKNAYVHSLLRSQVANNGRRPSYAFSLWRQLFWRLRALRGLLVFGFEVLIGWRQIFRLIERRGHWQGSKALVLGNGSSQGYLTPAMVQAFKANGGKVIAVNFFNNNKVLADVMPDMLVISDPNVLAPGGDEILRRRNSSLKAYLDKYPDILIAAPIRRKKDMAAQFGAERLVLFVDSELYGWTRNIKPFLPRGYQSMTALKSLALAQWFKAEKIFLLGLDNDYPRNLYSDAENNILALEVHAGEADFVINMSPLFHSVADYLWSCCESLHSFSLFKADNVLNLDPYSLTDSFEKNPDVSKVEALLSEE